MKHFFRFSALVLLLQAFGGASYAQTGLIDAVVNDAVLNAARTQRTFKILMKQGALYTPNWSAARIIIDIDYGSAAPGTAISNISQAVTSEATNPVQGSTVYGDPLPGHELEMFIDFSNPAATPAGELTSTYKFFTTVTVDFSAPVGPNAVFSIRDASNNLANNIFIQSRSNWAANDALGSQNEIAGQNPDNSTLTTTPLNVSLLSFNAAATPERTAKLEWETATEKNTSHFIVERSADGLRFTEQVCRMQAAGTSNDRLTYHNFDYKPLTGNNYYRLKMVDKDGSFKYSETRRVVFEAPISDVVAIPNPFQSATTIRVNADRDQMANYYVVDAAGRVISRGVWEVKQGVQEFPMPLEDAAAGNYILTVQGSTLLAELRLTKSN